MNNKKISITIKLNKHFLFVKTNIRSYPLLYSLGEWKY